MNSIKYIYRIIAVNLALLLFVTSIPYTYNIHYCHGKIFSIGFLGKAKSCKQISKKTLIKTCPHYKKMMAEKGHCKLNEKKNCENKTFQIKLKQDKVYFPTTIAKVQTFLLTSINTLIFTPKSIRFTERLPAFINYKPPILIKNLPILVQSFLL